MPRSAWALALIAQATGKNVNFWVPDYFCNESLRPLRDTGAKLDFYPISRDLEPDWTEIERTPQASAVCVFVLVHYFGHASASAKLAAEFCASRGAILVEDCAHILKPTPGIGEQSSFNVYSPHKTLPIPRGSVLVARNERAYEAARVSLKADVRFHSDQASTPWTWLVKRSSQRILPSPFLNCLKQSIDEDFIQDPPPTERSTYSSLSTFEINQLALYGTHERLEREARLRLNNEAALRQIFDGELRAWPAKVSTAPYLACLRAEDSATAVRIFRNLRAAQKVVTTWPDLPPEVRANPGKHSEAIQLRETCLFFPVHGTITPETLRAYYSSRSTRSA